MRAFAGLALASGTVSVVGLGSSCGAGDSGAVPVTVAISVSPVISMVNARVADGERAHLGGAVLWLRARVARREPGATARWRKGAEVVSADRMGGIVVKCVGHGFSREGNAASLACAIGAGGSRLLEDGNG